MTNQINGALFIRFLNVQLPNWLKSFSLSVQLFVDNFNLSFRFTDAVMLQSVSAFTICKHSSICIDKNDIQMENTNDSNMYGYNACIIDIICCFFIRFLI